MTSDHQERKRAACNECRNKKVKCTSEIPVCSRCEKMGTSCIYSSQKPMGRPKKRQRTTEATVPSTESNQGLVETLHGHLDLSTAHQDFINSASWNMDDFCPPFAASHSTKSIQEASASHGSSTSELPYEAPAPDLSVNSSAQPCACLSAMYLTLDNLRAMQDFTFPPSLHLLRRATATGWDVIHCERCPSRFLSAMQNVHILGLLLVSLVERYSRLLEAIDAEHERSTLANETRVVRVGDMSITNSHMHTGEPDCPSSFMVDLEPLEWMAMAKKAIKAEVLGKNGESDPALANLIKKLEARQDAWHASHPVKDTPSTYKHRAPLPGEEPTCLALAKQAKEMIETMKFD